MILEEMIVGLFQQKKTKYNKLIQATKIMASKEISTEDLTKCILEQESLIVEHTASATKQAELFKAMANKVEQLEAQNALAIKQATSRKENQIQKAESVLLALQTHWAKILDTSDFSKADQVNLAASVKNNPDDMIQVLRLAHCASKHYQNQYSELDRANKKRKLDTVAEDVGLTLAPKAQPDIMDVLSKYKVNGSASDLVRQAYESRNGL